MSRPGNESGYGGYALVDALVALLVAALAAGAVLAALGTVVRHAGKALDRATASVEERNLDAERNADIDEK